MIRKLRRKKRLTPRSIGRVARLWIYRHPHAIRTATPHDIIGATPIGEVSPSVWPWYWAVRNRTDLRNWQDNETGEREDEG